MRPIVVVKVGGSLLDWPELPTKLTAWLASLGPYRPVLIVGGGAIVDAIRSLDQTHSLGEEVAHALALKCLDVTGNVLHHMVNATTQVVTRLDELENAWDQQLIPILLPRGAIEADTAEHALPHSWEVTSDAIAGRIAVLIGAARVMLLKSAPAPADLAEAVSLGRVDRWFGRAKGDVPWDYVNLREINLENML